MKQASSSFTQTCAPRLPVCKIVNKTTSNVTHREKRRKCVCSSHFCKQHVRISCFTLVSMGIRNMLVSEWVSGALNCLDKHCTWMKTVAGLGQSQIENILFHHHCSCTSRDEWVCRQKSATWYRPGSNNIWLPAASEPLFLSVPRFCLSLAHTDWYLTAVTSTGIRCDLSPRFPRLLWL